MESAEPAVRSVGRYTLFDTIASGGMATVRFGRLIGPAGFSRTVAIKCLYPPFAADPEFVAMFLDEARLVARIRSPYVVPAIDVVALAGELFIVMEYVPGESLSRLLRPSGDAGPTPLVPVDIAVAVMCEVLEGLHAAHETRSDQGVPLGIVHRDVSPQNIIVGTDGLGRVIDFGVAKAAGRLQTTRDGQLKGKLAYMPPEQLRGDGVTRRSDVYAASVVLWEALTGERLFGADDEGAVVTRVLMGAVTPPSKGIKRACDAEVLRAVERLDAVVMRGLARAPDERFETAREMGIAVRECVTPASAATVSEWLERVAGPALAMRATRLAEIESGVASTPSVASTDLVKADPTDRLGPNDVKIGVDVLDQATQTASISVVTGPKAGSRSRRTWPLLAAIMIAGAIVAVSDFVLRGAFVARRAAFSAGSVQPSTTPLPPADSATGGTLGTAPPSASAPQPPAGSSAAVVPVVAGAAARPQVPMKKRTTAPPPLDCDPPFTWDAQGKKHYKPSCL